MAPYPPESDERNILVSETTGLIQRIGSNGSLPLTSSYSDVRDGLEQQLQETWSEHQKSSSKQLTSTTSDRSDFGRHKRVIWMWFLLGCVLCCLSAGIILRPWQDHRPSDDDDVINYDGNWDHPLSLLDPVTDLGLAEHTRSVGVSPDWKFLDTSWKSPHDHRNAMPTNAWYQNLIMARDEPSNLQRAYPVPYLVDVVGMIPGLRTHCTHVDGSTMVLQLSFNENFGLVLGATVDLDTKNSTRLRAGDVDDNFGYKVVQATDLGITLEWDVMGMSSSIVRGMPFTTMEYPKKKAIVASDGRRILPTIASPIELTGPILVDGGNQKLDCISPSAKVVESVLVEHDIELFFNTSDFTWMVFFSEPAWIQCIEDDNRRMYIQVVEYGNNGEKSNLGGNVTTTDEQDECSNSEKDVFVLRAALLDQCTTNSNPTACRVALSNRLPKDEPEKEEYTKILREHADIYPGRNSSFFYNMTDDEADGAKLHFHWDVQSMSNQRSSCDGMALDSSAAEILMFALPHHMDQLTADSLPHGKRYCKSSLTGPVCLVLGNEWTIQQDLPVVGFRAPRPVRPEFIPTLAQTLAEDMKFRLPGYMKRGAGDTYFSGKILAKLARILLIADEIDELCEQQGFLKHASATDRKEYTQFCKDSTLPSREQFDDSLDELRSGVEVWINGTAETPFVYDRTWGGVISCGCYMNRKLECDNKYPNCPGFVDQGLNFGNGFYNDHHFHYGYHIYAAAVVAHFDPNWGKKHFEQVLLLVRDIANPSSDDPSFPRFRHKDWYFGASWASGVPQPAYLNGKNQESSSEAIASAESVALFGQVMKQIWISEKQAGKAAISNEMEKIGKVMAGTEITSAKRYWHVNKNDDPNRIYPEIYDHNVVGMMWNTMLQFGTWFGAAEYLPYGIQLLPLTPISESRDDLDWANTIYKPLTTSCAADFQCTSSGWSVFQLAILATVGYAGEAAMRVKELPNDSFENAGGNGNSRTNTIWYIGTRPEVLSPIKMLRYDVRGKEELQPAPVYELTDCYLPDTCTDEVLDRQAGNFSEFTCRSRITWLITSMGQAEWDACWRVSGLEFPDECGPCNPGVHFVSKEQLKEGKNRQKEEEASTAIDSGSLQCLACTQEECNSDLNRCPVYKRTFVCTKGTSKGGCSGEPQFWANEAQCDSCCELTGCLDLKDKEASKLTRDGNALQKPNCPPCPPAICYGKVNQCPIHTAPYLCREGPSKGGCASTPWDTSDIQCQDCCEIKLEC